MLGQMLNWFYDISETMLYVLLFSLNYKFIYVDIVFFSFLQVFADVEKSWEKLTVLLYRHITRMA